MRGTITGYRAWTSQSISLIYSVSQQYISVNSIFLTARHNCNLGAQPCERPTRQPWSVATQYYEDIAKAITQFKNYFISFSLFSALFASWHSVFYFSSRPCFSSAWSSGGGAVACLELKTHRDLLARTPENNLARGWSGHLARSPPKHYC